MCLSESEHSIKLKKHALRCCRLHNRDVKVSSPVVIYLHLTDTILTLDNL